LLLEFKNVLLISCCWIGVLILCVLPWVAWPGPVKTRFRHMISYPLMTPDADWQQFHAWGDYDMLSV